MELEIEIEMNNFYEQFINYIKTNQTLEANTVLMTELGRIMVTKRDDFIYLLRYSGIPVPENVSDEDLINLFLENVKTNQVLLKGTAFLISHNNKMVGFDGEEYTSNVCADAIHKSMLNFFDGKGNNVSNFFDGERMSSFDGELFSYEDGTPPSEPSKPKTDWGATAKAGLELGSQALKNVESKRAAKSLPMQMTAAQQQAKYALQQSIAKERLAKQKTKTDTEKSKRTKMIVIGSAVIVTLLVVGIIAYKKLKK